MKRITLFYLLLLFFGTSSFAQKMTGFGAELSVLSIKPNVRLWISKTTGFEVFGGIASQIDENFKLDDYEAGFKFLHTLLYNRADRTYVGVVGKWKWAKGYIPNYKLNLPIAGILIGKEWYSKRIHRKSFAVELGYQYGEENFKIKSPDAEGTFTEFALILNLRYSFYKKSN